MKKLFYLTIAFLIFSYSSFGSQSDEIQKDCVGLAMDVHDAWTSQGYSHQWASQKADIAYDDCMNTEMER